MKTNVTLYKYRLYVKLFKLLHSQHRKEKTKAVNTMSISVLPTPLHCCAILLTFFSGSSEENSGNKGCYLKLQVEFLPCLKSLSFYYSVGD